MSGLIVFTVLAVLISWLADRGKTVKAFRIAVKKFLNILPAFIGMIILVSIVLYLIPDQMIADHLGIRNKFVGILIASFFGSITLMPGFIAFPLCGILLEKGVAYMVLSAFTTTLMMVGVLTFPVERVYLGNKTALIRNAISLCIALVTALITGLFFGELL